MRLTASNAVSLMNQTRLTKKPCPSGNPQT